MSIAYISLGSNLVHPQKQVQRALEELGDIPQSKCLRKSSLYKSAPMLPENKEHEAASREQPDYVNAVAELETEMNPLDLLHELQLLEALHLRVRGERWAPRTLDLDILLYDDRLITTPELTVPHPGLYERNFVLYPLAEIVPDLDIPGKGPLAGLLEDCEYGSLEKLSD